jgi:hypothetical protein
MEDDDVRLDPHGAKRSDLRLEMSKRDRVRPIEVERAIPPALINVVQRLVLVEPWAWLDVRKLKSPGLIDLLARSGTRTKNGTGRTWPAPWGGGPYFRDAMNFWSSLAAAFGSR